MDDGEAWIPLLDREYDVSTPLQPGDERIPAGVVLEEEQGEVGREALAEPDLVPVALGYRVAEPLVRNLMSDETVHSPARDRTLAVEDRAGNLHPPADPRGLDPGEFLIRERADVLGEELQHPAPRVLQGRDDRIAVLVVDPGLQRDALGEPGMVRGELGDAHGIEP